jgi:predicted PurR-regulated permease PerM
LSPILLPFVAGMAIAYLFNPLVDRLEGYRIRRAWAALLLVGLVVLIFIVLILLAVPIVAEQLNALIANFPDYVRRLQSLLADPSRSWLRRILGVTGSAGTIDDLVKQGTGWLTAFIRSLWSGGQALLSVFSLVVVTPVVAFYLLCDWPRMVSTLDKWIPLDQRVTVHRLLAEIDTAISGFVRGQTGICLILGSFYAVALTLAGLNFGLVIGLISGLISFIPYVGTLTGLLLAVGVAIAQFWPDWTWIGVILGIFLFGQFVEGYVLAPKLVGENIGIHPVWLIFAMFAFGYLFGFVGLLVAVPLAAIIGVLFRYALSRYFESPIYTGNNRPG